MSPLDGYHVQTRYRQPGKSGTTFEPRWEPLFAFPCDQEITNSNYARGWLRFSVGSMPSATVKDDHLHQEVLMRLIAFDSRGDPHLIYEGSTQLAGCGRISKLIKLFGTDF